MSRSPKKTSNLQLIRSACSNESGAALIIGLMFLAILALAGSTAMVLTSTDLQIGGNYKTNAQAISAAQAGMEEVRSRLSEPKTTPSNYTGDPATTPNPWWCAYLISDTSLSPSSDDRSYSGSYTNYIPTTSDHTNTSLTANSLQTGTPIPYLVKIRHKREYDAELAGHATSVTHYNDGDGSTAVHSAASPGNIIYYGDDPNDSTPNWVEFTDSAVPSDRDAKPVEIVTAYGAGGESLGITEVELRIAALGLDTQATLYAKNNVTSNGTVRVTGKDQGTCGILDPDKPPIYTYPTGTSTTLNGSSNELYGVGETDPTVGDAPPVDGDVEIDIKGFVDQFSDSATVTITTDQNGTTYGSPTNYVTCYSNTSDPYNVQGLKLQGVTGYGLLVVDGDLELGGGFTWSGLIMCTGTMVFNGGGGPNRIQITGAALANNTVAMNGSVDLFYDSCTINDALSTVLARISRWRQVY